MNSEVCIENLAAYPSHIMLVADWHHYEWLRGRHDSRSSDSEENLKKRRKVLESHLGNDAIPSTFIALIDKVPVGSASVVYYQFSRNKAKSPWLTNLFVSEEYREQGIGERLLKFACAQAKHAGIAKLSLYTHDQEAFYVKRGWTSLRSGRLQKRPVAILEKYL